MNNQNTPQLPDYNVLKETIDSRKNVVIKLYDLDVEEIRDTEDAKILLRFYEKIQTNIIKLFKNYPSLIFIFEQEYIPIEYFFKEEYIVENIFIDNFLFPEKQLFDFETNGKVDADKIDEHTKHINDWIESCENNHKKTIEFLKEKFDLNLNFKELSCLCPECLGKYRTKVLSEAFEQCLVYIRNSEKIIKKNIDSSLGELSEIYSELIFNLDKIYNNIRKKVKRSSINKIENQVKNEIKAVFLYPSDIAKEHIKNVTKFLSRFLVGEGYNEDLLTDLDYNNFFKRLSRNIWRGEKYLLREFNKYINSIIFLKRKDISGNILCDYIGEFWIHSQARAINRKIIYHMGPTNSGKTYQAIETLCRSKNGCYLAPLRLLATELFDSMNKKGVITTLLTGEEVIELKDSTHYSSTIEMVKLQQKVDCCVIDEIQMISDPQRGWAWTRALVNVMAKEIHLCGDPIAIELVEKIVKLCGDTLEIKEYQRKVPLRLEDKSIIIKDLKRYDALIVFSRNNAFKFKLKLEDLGFKVSIVYGMLSPEVRKEQVRKFDIGETDIIVSTDAISMGMNLPIKRIVFSTLTKFINSKEFIISNLEIKQISGRAGRYKRFNNSYVTCLSSVNNGLNIIKNALDTKLEHSKEAMIGPDLDIYLKVNNALKENGFRELKYSEFLRLFNTIDFKKPFYCVELNEMIELAEIVEDIDQNKKLSSEEIFGFICAPVNMGLVAHIQYFVSIVTRYINDIMISFEPIDYVSKDIDYLETSIKCVELFQWLARHFGNDKFQYDLNVVLNNKSKAIDQINHLLSESIFKNKNQFRGRNYNRSKRFSSRPNKRFKGGKKANKYNYRAKKKRKSSKMRSKKYN